MSITCQPSWILSVCLSSRYSLFKYEPVLEFGNLLNYTAMGLGNHDFDDGVGGLAPFVEETNYPG